MVNRIVKERFIHVRNAILLIQSFVHGQNLEDFQKDFKGQNAVLYQFLIIGEAVRHCDPAILNKYNYPWHIPKSFRNFIAHEYHKIKIEHVFNATRELEPLKKIIDQILENEF